MNIIIINEKTKTTLLCIPPENLREKPKEKGFSAKTRLLRISSSIIKKFDGTNEEKLGQFEIFSQSEEFQKRYPHPLGEDISILIRLQLLGY
jgi:hypothetical protein